MMGTLKLRGELGFEAEEEEEEEEGGSRAGVHEQQRAWVLLGSEFSG